MQTTTSIAIGTGAPNLMACTQVTRENEDSSCDDAVSHAQVVYGNECAQSHGTAGEGGGTALPGLGVLPPDPEGLSMRNGGPFPCA